MNRIKSFFKGSTHFYWALCLPVILIMYYIPERVVVNNYFPTQTALDQAIPFVSQFVVFYLSWFPLLAFTGFWLLFRDGDAFRRYMWFLTAAYALSMVFFLAFPNGQDLRPASFAHDDIFTRLCAGIYAADTNTNVLPSLHVVASFGVVFAFFDTPTLRSPVLRAAAVVLALLISASTVLIKQHAVMDLVFSAAMVIILYFPIYRFMKKKMKNR
ncbi:MAG: phosphatase PAP2 family protein [Oscillospiraceae bacterium]|nr:phosphatase PAP2 family protein [Oscillospiraceae bacterium]